LGILSLAKRGKLRDLLRQSLTEHDNAAVPIGQFLSINAVFDCLFTRSPLVSLASVRGFECCGRVYITEHVKVKRQVTFELPFLDGESVGERLHSLLSDGVYWRG
jgi:hypothetical protein